MTGHWNTKVGSQETPIVMGTFGFVVQNEAGQNLIEVCQENTLVIANTLFKQCRRKTMYGHHQMARTEIRLIIFFSVKDGEHYTVSKNKIWR